MSVSQFRLPVCCVFKRVLKTITLKTVYPPKKAFNFQIIRSFAYSIETDTTTRAISAFRKVCHLNYIKIFPVYYKLSRQDHDYKEQNKFEFLPKI